MKKIGILALIALFTMSFSVFSQPQQPNLNDQRGERPNAPRGVAVSAQQRAENLTKQLNLTDAQKEKLVAYYENQNKAWEKRRAEWSKQRDQMNQDREKTREEFRAEREKEMAVQDAELEKILGKEKMAEYKQIRQERMDRMNANRGQRPEAMRKKDENKQKNDSVPAKATKGKRNQQNKKK